MVATNFHLKVKQKIPFSQIQLSLRFWTVDCLLTEKEKAQAFG
jgi:hypothetical protein